MQWLKTILAEIFGLFVDDGSFAMAILAWLAMVRWVLPHIGVPSQWDSLILFAGLALVLVESATRFSRRSP